MTYKGVPEKIVVSKDGSLHVTNEAINTISHLAAACAAVLVAVLLIVQASLLGDKWKIIGLSVYGMSLIGLFVMSTLHHGVNGSPKVNEALRRLDYAAVFTLIGGTTTPLVLVLYRTPIGWSVLGAVWAIAVTGIALAASIKQLPRYITNTMYIMLGWLPVALLTSGKGLSVGGLVLLAAGGLVYSAGFAVYALQKPNLKPGVFGFHELWHCLVVVASLLHVLCMFLYVLPA